MTVKAVLMPTTIVDDAQFRAFGATFSAQLAAVGLVQTADTGQINWATVSKPGVSTAAGYEVWRMNDSQQGSSPIFFRFDYGVYTNVNNFWLRVSVGQGSDGAGNLTGTVLGPRIVHWNSSQTIEGEARLGIFSCSDGFFGFYLGMVSTYDASFWMCRSCDSDGVADDRGAIYNWGSGSENSIEARQHQIFKPSLVTGTARTSLATATLAVNPVLAPIGADVDELLVFLAFAPFPKPEPLFGVCGVSPGCLRNGMVFRAALVGPSVRRYIVLAPAATSINNFNVTLGSTMVADGLMTCFLWE